MMTERFDRALVLASQLHRQQIRKATGAPYVSHLLAVCALVLEYSGSEEAAIGALLHDAAEDQGGREVLQRIALTFGPTVAQLVEELSDSLEDTTNQGEKADWKTRKRLYLENLPHHSRDARLISLCDKTHNVQSLVLALEDQGANAWRHFKGGKEGSLWYFRELGEIFSSMTDLPVSLIKRFCKCLQELESVHGK